MRCDWAGCREMAVQFEDDYWHCGPHLNEHRLLTAEEQGRPRQRNGKPEAVCGTASGYKKHLRLKEPTCAACRKANNDANIRGRAA